MNALISRTLLLTGVLLQLGGCASQPSPEPQVPTPEAEAENASQPEAAAPQRARYQPVLGGSDLFPSDFHQTLTFTPAPVASEAAEGTVETEKRADDAPTAEPEAEPAAPAEKSAAEGAIPNLLLQSQPSVSGGFISHADIWWE